jgi:hypothetical protein
VTSFLVPYNVYQERFVDAHDGLLQQMYHNFGFFFFFSINSLCGPDLRETIFFLKFMYNLWETKMQIAHKVYDEMPQPFFFSLISN